MAASSENDVDGDADFSSARASFGQSDSPQKLLSLVYKQVKVEDADGKHHLGWVHTVDPVSNSIVLVQFSKDGGDTKIAVVLGHAVRHVDILNGDAESHRNQLDKLFARDAGTSYTKNELQQRKASLKEWLEKHRIPVTESGENGSLLSVSEALFIEPPYTADNCISTNEIILGRIQSLIRAKPES